MDMNPQEFVELEQLREVSVGSLSVVVDFNDLLQDLGEEETFALIGKLKELLA